MNISGEIEQLKDGEVIAFQGANENTIRNAASRISKIERVRLNIPTHRKVFQVRKEDNKIVVERINQKNY